MCALSAEDQIQELKKLHSPFVANDPLAASKFLPSLTKTSPSLTSHGLPCVLATHS